MKLKCLTVLTTVFLQVNPKTMDIIKTVMKQAYMRYSAGPVERSDQTLKFYLDRQFLLDGKSPPVNYISECPVKNRCSNCKESDHPRSNCPKIVCFNCGEQGHMASSCSNRKQNKNRKHLGTPDKKRIRNTPDKAGYIVTIE